MRTFVVLGVTLLTQPAWGGALGEVVGGLQRASDDDDDDDKGSSSSSSSSSNDDSSSDSSSHDASSPGTSGSSYSSSGAVGVSLVDWGPPPPGAPGAHVYLYLAGQSVVDSNGSLTAEMRAWYEDFGLGVRQTSFFEEARPKWLRLDLWAVSGHYRVVEDDRNELWIEGGLGGLRTIDDLTMIGAQGAVRAEHALSSSMAVSAEGRMYLLENNVRASEARAAFRVSVLAISYRLVDFNVGPPLHGPEIGLSLSF
jgi:hypothetical protein